jgi:hypothetical protein
MRKAVLGLVMQNVLAARRLLAMRRMLTGAAVIMTGAVLTASYASAQSCQDLWVERNSYYKDAGYCFKTARAISYFGNAGCVYDSEARVPLSRQVRARIDEITRLERRFDCN